MILDGLRLAKTAPASRLNSQNMNATPLLTSIVAALTEVHLEAILIGNAAAALQGAPVTTLDFDFMFRPTAPNLAKLKRFADRLEARREKNQSSSKS